MKVSEQINRLEKVVSEGEAILSNPQIQDTDPKLVRQIQGNVNVAKRQLKLLNSMDMSKFGVNDIVIGASKSKS